MKAKILLAAIAAGLWGNIALTVFAPTKAQAKYCGYDDSACLMAENIAEIKAAIDAIKADIYSVKSDVSNIKNYASSIESDVSSIRSDTNSAASRIGQIANGACSNSKLC